MTAKVRALLADARDNRHTCNFEQVKTRVVSADPWPNFDSRRPLPTARADLANQIVFGVNKDCL